MKDCKLLVLDRNTLNQKTVQIICIKSYYL